MARTHHRRPGPLGSPAEIAFWLGSCRQVPSVDEIVGQWRVGRSTAFRWRAFALAGGRSQQAGRIHKPGTPKARRIGAP